MFNAEMVNYTMRQRRAEVFERHIEKLTGEPMSSDLLCPERGIPFECRDQFLFFVLNVMLIKDESISRARKDKVTRACQRAVARIEKGWGCPESLSLCSLEYIHEVLWVMIRYLETHNIYLSHTDHLCDTELLHQIFFSLVEQPIDFDKANNSLPWAVATAECLDMCAVRADGADDYLRYYADDETRELWAADYDEPIPARQALPFDRDRHLPGMEEVCEPVDRMSGTSEDEPEVMDGDNMYCVTIHY